MKTTAERQAIARELAKIAFEIADERRLDEFRGRPDRMICGRSV